MHLSCNARLRDSVAKQTLMCLYPTLQSLNPHAGAQFLVLCTASVLLGQFKRVVSVLVLRSTAANIVQQVQMLEGKQAMSRTSWCHIRAATV